MIGRDFDVPLDAQGSAQLIAAGRDLDDEAHRRLERILRDIDERRRGLLRRIVERAKRLHRSGAVSEIERAYFMDRTGVYVMNVPLVAPGDRSIVGLEVRRRLLFEDVKRIVGPGAPNARHK